MPKDTFFRLPSDKRQRIIDAALEEFHKVPYSQASINKIIKTADIPRGSFYQYFEDKKDLFHYLISLKSEKMIERFCKLLMEEEGDIFRFLYKLIDRFEDFYHSERFGEILLFFHGLEPIRCCEAVKNEDGMLEDITHMLDSQMLNHIRFSILDVTQEERPVFINIIGAVVRESAVTMIHSRDGNLEKISRDLRKKIQSLEKHYRVR